MIMEPGIHELYSMIDGCRLGDPRPSQDGAAADALKTEDPEDFFNQNGLVIDPPLMFLPTDDRVPAPPASTVPQEQSPEDSEIFSDIALAYISDMLMEEEMDVQAYMSQDVEAYIYDVLGEQHLSSPDRPALYADSSESPEDGSQGLSRNPVSSGSHGGVVDNGCVFDFAEHPSTQIGVEFSSTASFDSSNSNTSTVLDGIEDPHQFRTGGEHGLEMQMEPIWQYRRGVEEAIKFLPDQNKLVINVEAIDSPLPKQHKVENAWVEVKVEKEEDKRPSPNGSRSRKNPHDDDDLDAEEGRSTKQSALSSEEDVVRSEMFDQVLLCQPGQPNDAISTLREALQNEVNKAASKNGHSKGANGGKSRGHGRRQAKKDVVDLRTLLIHCAQAVATDDRRSAGEMLRQIRQHSSTHGDGSQRLAHCFADGLEARLAGTGSEIYQTLARKRRSATGVLKAYQLYLAACPFKKISHFFSNQTILDAVEGSARLHIVDFGIYFGFQWPCLIQRLSLRPGGPPRLRITAIEQPERGFRPTERVEQTGRRLADYARTFGVPFEYNPISGRWEDIDVDDLKLDRDEVLVVNCLGEFRNVVDETVVVDSPRDRVLRSIRRMRPDVFIHAVVNGAYGGAPFFVTRFREALFHFSALFDMLEATVPREHPERLLIEREIFGREAINVIACEGSERVERPETYKQWQARNLRAGLAQLPLNPGIVRKAGDKVRSCYHKDFLFDQDGGWLLQGWKGRIIYALSTWRPNPLAS